MINEITYYVLYSFALAVEMQRNSTITNFSLRVFRYVIIVIVSVIYKFLVTIICTEWRTVMGDAWTVNTRTSDRGRRLPLVVSS